MLQNFPTEKYNTIVIDPPWDISMAGSRSVRPNFAKELHYKTMTLDEIKQIPICQIANKGCHVYCWTTNKMLRQTFDVLESWGVNFHLCLVWIKPSAITPCFAYKFATEFCLLGFYGKPMQNFIGAGKLNWIEKFQKQGKHSSKPDEFYNLIEQMSPAPRIDIFARQEREGWDVWGNEVPDFEQKLLISFPSSPKVDGIREE